MTTPEQGAPPQAVTSSAPGSVDTVRITRNVVFSVGAQLVSWALTLVVTLFVPRYLGSAMFGRLSAATAFVAVGFVLAPWGMAQVLTKEIARTPERLGVLVTNALSLRIGLAVCFGTLSLLVAYLVGYRGSMLHLIGIGAVGLLVAGINEIFAAALAGQERFKRQGVVTLIDKAVSSGASVLLVVLRAPVTLFAWPAVAASLVQSGLHIRNLTASGQQLAGSISRPSRDTIRFLMVAGLPYLGQSAFLTLYGQTDVVVLTMLTDYTTVGWYNVAWKLVGTTMFLPVAVASALLPSFSRLHHAGDEAGFEQLGRRALELVMVVAVPIAVVLLLIPDVIIRTLYTTDFEGAILVLRIGGICSLLYYVTIILSTLVNARDEQKRLTAMFSVACLGGAPSCLFFVTMGQRLFGNGAAGAVFSDALVELTLLLAILRLLPRGFIAHDTLQLCGRFALASLPMAGLLFFCLSSGRTGLWIVAPAGGLYLLGLWALRAIDARHLDLFRRAVRR